MPGTAGVVHARVCPGDEGPVEGLTDDPGPFQRIDQIKVGKLKKAAVLQRFALDPALEIAIHARGGSQLEAGGFAQPGFIGAIIFTHRAADLAHDPLNGVGIKFDLKPLFGQLVLQLADEDLLIGLGFEQLALGGVEFRFAEGKFYIHHRVGKGRGARADDGHGQHQQEEQANRDGGDTIGAEPGFGGVALAGARIKFGQRCVLAFATVFAGSRRSFVLLPVFAHDVEREDVQPEGDDEQGHAKGKGHQRLGACEIRIPGQLADDLGGHGGHGLKWVERQPRRGPCPQHHNHGFTDGARRGQQDLRPRCPAKRRAAPPGGRFLNWSRLRP